MKSGLVLLLFSVVFSCKSPQARRPISISSGSEIKTSVQRNKKLVAREEASIKKIIQKDSSHLYLTSSNGFWYYYNKEVSRDTLKAKVGDLVNFNYNISTLGGKSIYTTEEIGTREYKMDQENIFSGMRQALKLLKPGETATFLFPSHKAFGYYGDRDRIDHNIPIKSKVTLNSIKKENKNQQKPNTP